jgi:hypothetical protein|tara:strand:- start:616 stop:756 length:141 start_codon:yes stop_codon:yes gene_type:complete
MDKKVEIYNIITKKRWNRSEPSLRKDITNRIPEFVTNQKPIKLIGF